MTELWARAVLKFFVSEIQAHSTEGIYICCITREASVAMWTPQQKLFCMLSLAELKSVKLVQCHFCHE